MIMSGLDNFIVLAQNGCKFCIKYNKLAPSYVDESSTTRRCASISMYSHNMQASFDHMTAAVVAGLQSSKDLQYKLCFDGLWQQWLSVLCLQQRCSFSCASSRMASDFYLLRDNNVSLSSMLVTMKATKPLHRF